MKHVFKLTFYPLIIFSALVSCFSGKSSVEDQNIQEIEKIIEVQTKFHSIIQLLELMDVDGLNKYPLSDFLIKDNPELQNKIRTDILRIFYTGDVDQEFISELIQQNRGMHWESIMCYSISYYEWTNSTKFTKNTDAIYSSVNNQTLNQAISGELFLDPFNPSFTFGYIGVNQDFMILSCGPDGDNDILAFNHLGQGGYDVDSQNLSLVFNQAKVDNIKGEYSSNNAKIITSIDKYYDPTNGVLSNGDIVFKISDRENFLFEYKNKHLDDSALRKKSKAEITSQFK